MSYFDQGHVNMFYTGKKKYSPENFPEWTRLYRIAGGLSRDTLDMVKVKPTFTLDLENGQRVTLDLKEAKELVKILGKHIDKEGGIYDHINKVKIGLTSKRGRRRNKTKNNVSMYQGGAPSMSEEKRREILGHFNKGLSSKPMTLSSLLKGISHSPNYLPYIRSVIENQPNVTKRKIGKRIYYSYSSGKRKQAQTHSLEALPSRASAA